MTEKKSSKDPEVVRVDLQGLKDKEEHYIWRIRLFCEGKNGNQKFHKRRKRSYLGSFYKTTFQQVVLEEDGKCIARFDPVTWQVRGNLRRVADSETGKVTYSPRPSERMQNLTDKFSLTGWVKENTATKSGPEKRYDSGTLTVENGIVKAKCGCDHKPFSFDSARLFTVLDQQRDTGHDEIEVHELARLCR